MEEILNRESEDLILLHNQVHDLDDMYQKTIEKNVSDAAAEKIAARRKELDDSLTCLAKNIYYESATEPYAGKVAVAQVTLNRVHDSKYPNTICGVVYYKKINPITHKKEAAFSWTLGSRWRSKGMNFHVYKECLNIARAMLTKHLRSDIIGSNVEYYHADYINPSWAEDYDRVAEIGHHIFYK